MLVSLGVLTQHPTVNLVRERSGSYLISHMPPKFDLSLQQKANPAPSSHMYWTRGLGSVIFQQGEGNLSHLLQPHFFKKAYKTHLKY